MRLITPKICVLGSIYEAAVVSNDVVPAISTLMTSTVEILGQIALPLQRSCRTQARNTSNVPVLQTNILSCNACSESSFPAKAQKSIHTCRLQAGGSLTHVDSTGKASMVDIGHKARSSRVAVASGRVHLGHEAFTLVQANQMKKGDVVTVAQLAGIMGAKHTSLLIPLCHNIPLSKVGVNLRLDPDSNSVSITGEASTTGQTGVEMEALTAVSVAALTVYDMCKAVSKDICITDIRLEAKSGGQSGTYDRRTEPPDVIMY